MPPIGARGAVPQSHAWRRLCSEKNEVIPTVGLYFALFVGQYAAAHLLANTSSSLVESCTVCHQAGAAYDVENVHAQYLQRSAVKRF